MRPLTISVFLVEVLGDTFDEEREIARLCAALVVGSVDIIVDGSDGGGNPKEKESSPSRKGVCIAGCLKPQGFAAGYAELSVCG